MLTRSALIEAIEADRLRPKLMTAGWNTGCSLCDATVTKGTMMAFSSRPRAVMHQACFFAVLDDAIAKRKAAPNG